MQREAILVIDVGTSKVHANVIALSDGSLLAEAAHAMTWLHPQPGWTEIEPEDLWQAVTSAVAEAISKLAPSVRLIAVSNSFQGDGFLLAGRDGEPLYNIIVAMDSRGVPYVKDFAEQFGAERFEEILGTALGPWEPMKYYWFHRNRPELLAQTTHVVSVQEYVLSRLGLGYCQDYTLASRKVMRDYRKNEWSEELCRFVGLSPEQFDSPIMESGAVCGSIRRIGDTDLGAELPVIVGAHDCEMGMFGVGVLPDSRKVLANVAGTTDHLGLIMTAPFDIHGLPCCIYRGPMEGSYVALGANSVGSCTTWAVKNLFPERTDYGKAIAGLFSEMRFDGTSRVTCTGSIPSAAGVFRGIDLQTTREDLFRALIEGLTYPLQDVCRAMEAIAGGKFGVIRAGNGGAKSRSWLQLKADLFDTPVERVRNNEISSVGAAALAAVTLGRYGSLAEAQERMISVLDRVEPVAENVRRYAERVAEWKQL